MTDMQKIESIIVINKEIMQRLEACRTETIVSYKYKIFLRPMGKDKKFCDVTEIKEEISGNSIVNNWKCSVVFEAIPDLFNDKVDYKITNYSQLVIMHCKMEDIIHRVYTFLGETISTIPVLPLFKKNFELCHICFGEIEGLTLGAISELQRYEAAVQQINSQLLKLAEDKNVIMGDLGLKSTFFLDKPEYASNFPYTAFDVTVNSSSSYHSGNFTPAKTINNISPSSVYWLSSDGKITDEYITYEFKSVMTVTKVGLISSQSYSINPRNIIVQLFLDGNWTEVGRLVMYSGMEVGNKWQIYTGFTFITKLVRLVFMDRNGSHGGPYILLSGVAFA